MANSVDPDQTAPGSSLFWVHAVCFYTLIHQLCWAIICSRQLQQMTFSDAFFLGALRIIVDLTLSLYMVIFCHLPDNLCKQFEPRSGLTKGWS